MEEVTDKTVPKENVETLAIKAMSDNIAALTYLVDALSKLVSALVYNVDPDNFKIPTWKSEEELQKAIGELTTKILEAQSGPSKTDKS